MSWANYQFPGVNKTDPMTQLAPSTDEEITERISASTSSFTTESNEDISNQTRSLKVSIIKPKSKCQTRLCWYASS